MTELSKLYSLFYPERVHFVLSSWCTSCLFDRKKNTKTHTYSGLRIPKFGCKHPDNPITPTCQHTVKFKGILDIISIIFVKLSISFQNQRLHRCLFNLMKNVEILYHTTLDFIFQPVQSIYLR